MCRSPSSRGLQPTADSTKIHLCSSPSLRWLPLWGHDKIPWQTKASSNDGNPIFTPTKPGECISINHIQSTEPGFYGRAKGALTKTCYKNATVFVDHYLHLKFVYLMTNNLTLSETLDAKRTFEHYAVKHDVKIKHYHCNNGSFADNQFHAANEVQQQSLPSAGSMPTSRMASPSTPSMTSWRGKGSSSSMLTSTGRRL
jgi:hypothetical protein